MRSRLRYNFKSICPSLPFAARGHPVSGVLSDGAVLSQLPGTLNSDKSYEQFVAKYSTAGVLQWFRRYGGPDEIKSQGGGELEVSEENIVYVVGGFRNRLELFDEKGISQGTPHILNHPRDVSSLLAFGADGTVVDAITMKGTNAPVGNEAAGNVASGVITTRKVGSSIYLARGAVLEGTGDVQITTAGSPLAVSSTTREFSVTLFIKK